MNYLEKTFRENYGTAARETSYWRENICHQKCCKLYKGW